MNFVSLVLSFALKIWRDSSLKQFHDFGFWNCSDSMVFLFFI